jgi:uncharacterized protein (DUF488 family)
MVLTIGHSTHAVEKFIGLLKTHGVELLIDVRTVPKSRYNPQFNRESLCETLRAAGIQYEHMPGLGGLRKPHKDSPNSAWKNASFRGYADYMQTAEFAESLTKLVALSHQKQVAVMCAEAVPWRCHRSLICDGLLARHCDAAHIMNTNAPSPHGLTEFAEIHGTQVLYPAAQMTLPANG